MNATSQYSTYATTGNTTAQVSTESPTVTKPIQVNFTDSNDTVAETNHTYTWATELAIFEGINIALLVIVTWLLFNLIAYGIKTGRFRKKAQSSSLNSGIIYIACVLAVLCLLFRMIVTVMIHVARRQGRLECESYGDLSTFGYGLNLYAIYMFLWLRQRLIYTHPFVRSKVNTAMNWFSRLYAVFLTAIAVALMCVFLIPKTYYHDQSWCLEDRPAETSYILGGTFFIAQALMLWLCIYPATTGSIQTVHEDRIPEPTTNGDIANGNGSVTQEKQIEEEPIKGGRCCCCCAPGVVTSPVEIAIRRTVISSTLVVLTDIIAVVIESVAFPKDSPAVIRQTTVQISNVLDLFWAVGTFGFALNVFTLFCPSCSRRHETKEQTDTRSVGGSTVDVQI